MAEDNITSWTVNTAIIGLLTLSLISFFVIMANSEGQDDIFDGYDNIEGYRLNLSSTVSNGQLLDTSNANLNLSASYDAEGTVSGVSKTGNVIATNLQALVSVTWSTLMVLGSLLFGSVFSTISSLLIGIIGTFSVYYIIKNIRTGTW